MSWVYDEQDYHGYVDDEYRRYAFFERRGITFDNQWNGYKNNTLLIAGCGWGFLVQELMQEHGFTDVWGCDASEYAVNVAAPRELPPEYASRILLGDITSESSMLSVANQAGISGGNPRFRAVLTEDVLPCMTNEAEASQALAVLRARSRDMAHIITPRIYNGVVQPDGSVNYPWGSIAQMPGFLWLSHDEWIDLIGSGEPILFTDTEEVSNI